MTGQIVGEAPSRPALAVLGTWEPFLPEHEALLNAMQERAARLGLQPVVILMDPPPQVYVRRPEGRGWPIYEDVQTRIDCIRKCGIPTIMRIDFRAEDLAGTCREFFDLVCAEIEVGEFWRRKDQSIGSGVKGDGMAILRACLQRKIRLHRAPVDGDGRKAAFVVRSHLQRGRVLDAVKLVGRFPSAIKPKDGVLRRAWCPGRYFVASSEKFDEEAIPVELAESRGGGPLCSWPKVEGEKLYFVAGPSDG